MQEVSPGAREYRPNGPSVVILGGGFGGLHAARALRHAPVRVTLVDRRNHHLFQPLLWAAGVAASPLARSLGAPLDRAGRVLVNPDLTVPGRDDIFVIGDLAALVQDARPIPGVASAAIQEGRHAAGNIVRALHGEPCLPFRYRDKGSFATIGRGAAVGELLGGFQLSGFLAWLAWLVVHIYFLMGFRNRLLVMFHWAYSYLTYGARGSSQASRAPGCWRRSKGRGQGRAGTRPSASAETCERTHRWPRATRMRLKGWKILSKPSNRPARNRPNEERTMTVTAKITKRSTMQEVLRARRRLAETA